ncbi:MAG TPA: carboxypeptidase-like regulatory domain-containing protein [Planctomycetota bacterium]
MRLLRPLLASIALGTALIMLASVAFPPADERDDPVPPEALAGLADRTPASLGPDAEPARKEVLLTPGSLRYLELEVRDAADGAALGGVRVDLFHVESDGRERRTPHEIDAAGPFRLGPLPAVPLEFEVSKPGFFPSVRRRLAAQGPLARTVVVLQPAASVTGSVRALDAAPARAGVMSFEDLAHGTLHQVRVARGGRFESPPLAAGTWRIEWREHVQAQADPALRRDVALEAGMRLVLQVTLPLAGAGEPAGLVPGFEIRR